MGDEANCSFMSSPVCAEPLTYTPAEAPAVCQSLPAPVAPPPVVDACLTRVPVLASMAPKSPLVSFPTMAADKTWVNDPAAPVCLMPTAEDPATEVAPACTPLPAGAAELYVPQQTQVGNACGTTSLSMVLSYYGAPAPVASVTHIDGVVRPTGGLIDSFSAPKDLADYAKANGFRATLHNNASASDLRTSIDSGVPPVVLIDRDAPHGTALHYVVVSGYSDTADGPTFQVTDPNGYKHEMSEIDLNAQWSNLHLKAPVIGSTGIGYNRLMLSVVPEGKTLTKPNCQPAVASDAVALPSDNAPTVVNHVGSWANTGVRAASGAAEIFQKVSPYVIPIAMPWTAFL